MTPMPAQRQVEVSVIIATRDRPDMLARCLGALLAGPVWPREIVVVDQSGDERTADVVQSCAPGLVEVVYLHQAGQGLGRAQNLAVRRARCAMVAVTDDDCVPAETWLTFIEAGLAGPDAVNVLTGAVLPYGPARPDGLAVAARTSRTRVEFGAGAMPWEIGSGNNFAVQRAWLEKIGGNDERLGPGSPGQGGVDMDLFYQLARAGARIRYEPEAVVFHERVDPRSRLARRVPYGYGMGACCSLWLRQGDANALRVLGRWWLMRSGRLASGLARGDGRRVREEALILAGTLGGLLYGWRATLRPRSRWLAGELAQPSISQ